MKIFKKFGILFLMLILLGGAFVLPKFVQRASTEDMVPAFVKADEKIAAEKEAIQSAQRATDQPVETVSETAPALTLTSSEVLEFFDLVQEEKFPEATKTLSALSDELPDTLKSDLADRLAKAQERAQTAAAAKVAEAQQQAERVAELEKSMKKLAQTNQLAGDFAAETAKLREELAAVRKEQKEQVKRPALSPKAPEPLAAEQIPEVISIAFDSDSSVLKESDQTALAPAITALKKEPRLSLQLRGYADSRGDSAYNGILALARAEAVKDYLIENGVPGNRVSVLSFGETQAGAATPANVQRRVEVRFREG